MRFPRQRLGNARLHEEALRLYDEEAAAVRVARAQQRLEDVSEWLPAAPTWIEELEDARIRVQEVAVALREKLQGGLSSLSL